MNQNTPFRKTAPWVVFLSLMFFINYTGRSILGPLLVYIEKELGIDHSTATGLIMYVSAGFSVCMIFAGFIPSRIKPRLVIAISCGGTGIMLMLLSYCTDFFWLSLCMVAAGAWAGIYFSSAMAFLGSIISRENWSRAIAIHELGPSVSFVMAPLIAEVGIRLSGSWRGALVLWGAFFVCVSLLWLLTVREGNRKIDPPSIKGIKSLARQPVVWFFCWAIAMGIAAEFAPFNVMSLHLTAERGFSPDVANRLLSFSRIASPFVVILGGALVPRFGMLNTLRAFFILNGACLVVMGLPGNIIALPAIFLQALMPAFAWPAILSILPEKFPMNTHPTIISMTMPLAAYLGNGLTPKLLGILGDHFSFSTGFIILGCVSIATLPACNIIKK